MKMQERAPQTWTDMDDPVRDRILAAFLEAGDRYVSGSELSQRLGLTRTAIWKHIQALSDLGFVFAAAPRRGYRLQSAPDLLLAPLLYRQLPQGAQFGRHVVWLPEVDSTNAIAAQLAAKGAPHGTVVTALVQNGGRGRRGRAWFSPQGGLWMSLILRRPLPLAKAHELTLLTSVAVHRAVRRQTDLPLAIKWPNDLLCRGRKVCGILAEIRAEGETVEHAVLGIGLNTNIPDTDFPSDIREIATSLLVESGRPVSHLQLVGELFRELEPMYDALARGEDSFAAVADEWRAHSATLGQRVRVQTGHRVLTGLAERLDDDGVLHLRCDDGTSVAIHSGDVLWPNSSAGA
jgi:BirA family biotin operon repressor/biotin-[acetyl-CoA-carboxylase] ligase